MAKQLKILTLADGFGDSLACPHWYPEYFKWPKILGLMTKNTTIIDHSRYGAGNEFMINCLKQNYSQADVVFVQWAAPNRLDLMLCHEPNVLKQWQNDIANDPVYNLNFQTIGDKQWWISSASTIEPVITYHQHYITQYQHQSRSRLWIEYAHQLLQSHHHGFLLTANSEYLDGILVENNSWIWHHPWKGMHDWRYHSQYRELDLGLTQPIPLIHFDFIRSFIMPKFDLNWRNEREITAIELMLLRKYNQYKDKKPL